MTTTLSRPSARPGQRRTNAVPWTFLTLTAVAIAALAAVPYAIASLDTLAEWGVGLAEEYATQPWPIQAALYAHIAGGAAALASGPFQFARRLRQRSPRAHRLLGRLYVGAVGVGGVAGLIIAPVSPAGWVGLFGFGSLAVLWLWTAARAVRAIRARDVASHRAWMMRNYSLTYGAVTLRIVLPLLLIASPVLGTPDAYATDFANAYAAVPFLAWLPNLVVAEWLIRRRGLPSYRLTAA